jgi:hypothetical protein
VCGGGGNLLFKGSQAMTANTSDKDRVKMKT